MILSSCFVFSGANNSINFKQQYTNERQVNLENFLQNQKIKEIKKIKDEPSLFIKTHKYYFLNKNIKIEHFLIGDIISVFLLDENDLELEVFTGKVVNLKFKKNSIIFKIFLLNEVFLTIDTNSPLLCGIILLKYGNK